MNLAQVARLMAGFAGLLTLAQVPPLVFALQEKAAEHLSPVAGFVASMAIGATVAARLWLAGRHDRGQISRNRSGILTIVLLWLVCVVFGALVISLDERMNFVAALATSASMQGSCGPALTMVDPGSAVDAVLNAGTAATIDGTPNIGPFGGYGELRPWTKLVLVVQMVLGRLELLTVLALFAPSLWRR